MQYYLLVHCNNDYTNAPQHNVTRKLRAFITFEGLAQFRPEYRLT